MDKKKGELEPSEEDIQHLRQWLLKMPHLLHDYDDHILKSWIIGSKGSLQKVKETIEMTNRLGLLLPDIFGHLDPLDETTQYFLSRMYLFPMSTKTDDGCIVVIEKFKGNERDTDKFSVLELARYIFMTYMVLLYENNIRASKFIHMYDCKNTGLTDLRTLSPRFLKEGIKLCMAFPIRFKGGIFLRTPHYLLPILTFVQSLLPKKLSDRIHFINCKEELHQLVSKRFLPKEFGGDAGDLDTLHDLWKRKVESYRGRLISENKRMRQLDYLRPKAVDSGQGSFRKLEVD